MEPIKGALGDVHPKICSSGQGDVNLNRFLLETGGKRRDIDPQLVEAESIIATLQKGEVPEKKGPEQVQALMWYAMAQACEYGEEHLSGSFRMEDPDGKIRGYLDECLQGVAYPRISTHMKEFNTPQFGADFDKGLLPGNKGSLLYTSLPGTPPTIFFKLENSGTPPFWKKGFRNLKNFHTYAKHMVDYITTRFKPASPGIYQARKEHVPKDFKKRFSIAMGASPKQGVISKIFQRSKPPKEVKKALKFGVSEMERQLEKAPNPDLKLQEALEKRKIEARERGYHGDIKGNEVILPCWSRALRPF